MDFSLAFFVTFALVLFEVRGRVTVRFMGCLAGRNLLKGFQMGFPDLTVESCNNLCFLKGFTHAALSNGTECGCGDFMGEINRLEKSECGVKCRGNFDQKCGGRGTTSLYHTGIKELSASGKEIGCFSDGGLTHLIPENKMELPLTNSPDRCFGMCNSLLYKHAGLQNSVDCYCGNMDGSGRMVTGCDLPCPGDKQKTCGGKNKMMVYETGVIGNGESTRIKYLGCYKTKPKGLFRHYQQHFNDLQPIMCLAKCFALKYQFAALFNGTQCQCGKPSVPLPELTEEIACSEPCAGNKSATCGGITGVSMYWMGIIGEPILGRGLGCFKDEGGFLLSGAVMNLGHRNSPYFCIYKCIELAFPYAALSNVYECRCGSFAPRRTSSIEVEGSQCNSVCITSKSEFCGGPGLSYVYRTGLDEAPCELSTTELDGQQTCSGNIIMEERFDTLNPANWIKTVQISSNDYEFVTYNSEDENVYIESGQLVIKPTVLNESFIQNGHLNLKGCTAKLYSGECEQTAQWFNILPPVQSARLCSARAFKYGIITIRAKLPAGDWIIPRIELRPEREVYGRGYLSGAIRIAFSRGNAILTSGSSELGSTRVESGILVSIGDDKVKSKTVSFFSSEPWSEGFHNYTLIWNIDGIWAYVDGKVKERKKIYDSSEGGLPLAMGFSREEAKPWSSGTYLAPFDYPMEICLGVGVGGFRDFPDESVSSGRVKPWRNYQVKGRLNFWQAHDDWLPSWSDPTLKIDHISITAN